MKRFVIATAALAALLCSCGKKVDIYETCVAVAERAVNYIDPGHYAGTVYTQALAELYNATGRTEMADRALSILDGFVTGEQKGYGSFISYQYGGTAAPEMAWYGFDAPRAQGLQGADSMWVNQARNRDGVMLPPWKGGKEKNSLFVDCVFAVTPYLLYSGLLTGNQEWIDYAAWMTIKTFDDLYDGETGIIHQARAVKWMAEGQMTEDCWSRGNGWGCMALGALMADLPKDNKYYDRVCEIARNYYEAALKFQDENGMWHQEMTWKDSFIEVSGSALILYGLGRGIENGVLPESYMDAFRRGIDGLLTYIDEKGNVGNTCSGCLAYKDGTKAAYASHDYFCNEQHAFGPALLALGQALKMGIRKSGAELGSAIAGRTPSCYVRCISERKNDIAWENDRVAYRIYSQIVKNKVSSGVDFWTKKVDYPIVDKWYAKSGSYHDDEGEGYDFYSVGKNRGIGGVGIWTGDSLAVPEPYAAYEIIENQTEACEYRVDYPAIAVAGDSVRVSTSVRMLLGTYFYEGVTSVKTDSGNPVQLAVGVTNFGAAEILKDEQRAYLGLVEEISEKDGSIGSTVIADPASFAGYATFGRDELVLVNIPSGASTTYFVGAGWSRDTRFDPFSNKWPKLMSKQNWASLYDFYKK